MGTKTRQEDVSTYKIGKFGIGFKLAHRLVGESNGLTELINDYQGPILFSWSAGEWQQLADEGLLSFTPIGGLLDETPWFFKILLTCFPCQPNDEVYDIYLNVRDDLFSPYEIEHLRAWLRAYRDDLGSNFDQGSLFFIKLGKGKETLLHSNHLETGVRFSTAVMNKLSTTTVKMNRVVLGKQPVVPPTLRYWSVDIDTNDPDYDYVLNSKGKAAQTTSTSDATIQLLMGYVDHQQAAKVLHDAPNLYLYFPMSEEQHHFPFIIHSNAFYMAATRTYLHEGEFAGGINKRLFEVFVRRLSTQLLDWSNSTDAAGHEQFLTIYPNLLRSDESLNPQRQWINEPLIAPLQAFCRRYVPACTLRGTRPFELMDAPTVFILDTGLPLAEGGFLDPNQAWFYWSKAFDGYDNLLCEEAQRRLQLKSWTVLSLLAQKVNTVLLSTWLTQDNERLRLFLTELNTSLTGQKSEIEGHQTLLSLTILSVEGEADTYRNLSELFEPTRSSDILIRFPEVNSLQPYLTHPSVGFRLTTVDLADYPAIYEYLKGRQLSYFHDYQQLRRLVNNRLTANTLTPTEKQKLLISLEKLTNVSGAERRGQIEFINLYCNRISDSKPVPFNQLLDRDYTTPVWLRPFKVNEAEYVEAVKRYTIQDDAEIYSKLIVPFWEQITDSVTSPALYDDVLKYFNLDAKRDKYLEDEAYLLSAGKWYKRSETVHVHPYLEGVLPSTYFALSRAIYRVFNQQIPDQKAVPHLKKHPFLTPNQPLVGGIGTGENPLSKDEVSVLLEYTKQIGYKLFDRFVIQPAGDGLFSILPKAPAGGQYYHTSQKVISLIEAYYGETFVRLPDEFNGFVSLLDREHQGHELVNLLIGELNLNDQAILQTLTELALDANNDTKKKLVGRLGTQTLTIGSSYRATDRAVLAVSLWCSLPLHQHEYLAAARQGLQLKQQDRTVPLTEAAAHGSDRVVFKQPFEGGLSVGRIVPSQTQFYGEWLGTLFGVLRPLIGNSDTLKQLLNLEQSAKPDVILQQLKQVSHKPLQNADQLAFLLLCQRAGIPGVSFSEWKINNHRQEPITAKHTWYVAESPCTFLPETHRLHANFTGLAKILGLSIQNHSFKQGHITIQFEPELLRDCSIRLDEVTQSLSEPQQQALLSWYYERCRTIADRPDTEPRNEQLALLLGIELKERFLNTPVARPVEEVPQHIRHWIAQPNTGSGFSRHQFMQWLGVKTTVSPVVKLRLFLQGGQPFSPTDLNPKWVEGTLRWLAWKKVGIDPDDRERMEAVRNLYTRLDQTLVSSLPLPYQQQADEPIYFALLIDSRSAVFMPGGVRHKLNEFDGALSGVFKRFSGGVFREDLLTPAQQQLLSEVIEKTRQISSIQYVLDEAELKTAPEWEAPFYTQWRKQYPNLKICRTPGELTYQLLLNGILLCQVRQHLMDMNKAQTLLIASTQLSDEEIIRYAQEKWGVPGSALHNAWQKQRQQLADLYEKAHQFPDSDQYVTEELDRLVRALEKKQEIQTASATIREAPPYTLTWFKALIELERKLSVRGEQMGQPGGNIEFGKFTILETPDDGQTILEFSNPSRVFHHNLELYNDFKATFSIRDDRGVRSRKELLISGVSKKQGQRMYALISDQKARQEAQSLLEVGTKHVERISLSFSHEIDFLARLQTAYEGLNLSDSYNFYSHLTDHLQFVFGPPGTGKTTYLAIRILSMMQQKPTTPILVLTPTNKAADVLTQRILKEAAKPDNTFRPDLIWLTRFGATAEERLIEDGYFQTSATYGFRAGLGTVLVTTIHRFLYEQITGSNGQPTLLSELPWETIIVDEASMIPLTYINYVLHKRKRVLGSEKYTEFIIGGDPFQLPPIVDIPNEALPDAAIKEENIYSMVGLKTFNAVEQRSLPRIGDKITNLTMQYRSIPAIGEVFSQFQYGGLLAHGRTIHPDLAPHPRPLPRTWRPLGIEPLTHLRFICNTIETIYEPKKLLRSPYQLYAAQVLVETLRWMANQLPADEKPWQIGVVTPYRAQAQLVSKLTESLTLPVNFQVVVDTVHGFQGDECDIMFVLFNPPTASISGDKRMFLHKEHLVNVAISRARDYMILMYPDEQTVNIQNLRLIHASQPNSVGHIIMRPDLDLRSTTIAASDWEELLFNEPNYLSQNTFTNPHQMVNVYGRAALHYTVRTDETTLDVQIKW